MQVALTMLCCCCCYYCCLNAFGQVCDQSHPSCLYYVRNGEKERKDWIKLFVPSCASKKKYKVTRRSNERRGPVLQEARRWKA